VSIEVHAQCYPHGHSRRSIRADLVKAMRTQIVAMGLADEPELDALDRHARDLFADPDRVIVSGLLFAAWGRKPG